LWHNEYISGLIAEHRSGILPLIFPVLHVNSQSHWNPTVNNLTVNVLKIFMELDSSLVEQCQKKYNEEVAKKETREKQKAEIWQRLDLPNVSQQISSSSSSSSSSTSSAPTTSSSASLSETDRSKDDEKKS